MLDETNGTEDNWGINDSENDGFPFLKYQEYQHNTGCTPTTQASNLFFTPGDDNVVISWTNGNGASRAVFITQATTGEPTVSNNTTYTPNTTFGSGTEAGTGWYCVYNGTSSTETVTGLIGATQYRVMVLEYNNGAGDERYNIQTINYNPCNFSTNKEDQTITFNALTSKIYGDSDFALEATANSGLTVEYTTSDANIATIVSGNIHITGAGTCTIYADQPGNDQYNAAPQESQSFTVSKKELTITGISISDKVYDRTNTAAITGTAALNGVETGDVVTLDESGTTAIFNINYNVGTDKSTKINGYSITGADAGNYDLSQSTGLTADIIAKELTITGVTAVDKVYDADTDATLDNSSIVLNGVINPDDVNLSGSPAGTFDNKNVGTDKTVTASGYTISGTEASNYTVAQPTGLSADITKADLIITGTVTVNTKTYDATTTATLTGGTLSGILSSDDVSINERNGTFDNKNVGTGKTVTPSFTITGTDAGNYALTQPSSVTGNIIAKEITVTGITISNKTYDGNTDATISGTAALSGVESGDVVTLDESGAVASFDNKNIGTNKTITVEDYEINGTDKDNYSLTQPSGLTADITTKTLTITGVTVSNKVYDGNTDATIDNTNAVLSGVESGDVVNLETSSATATYDNKNVGTSKTVSTSLYSINGTDATNYSLTQPTLTGDITTKAITVTANASQTKVYGASVLKLQLKQSH